MRLLLLAPLAALSLAACPTSSPAPAEDGDLAPEWDLDGDGWFESEDCDDSDAAVHPDAFETCATPWDDDCDGQVNQPDAEGCQWWYSDQDMDGVGDDEQVACICTSEPPFVVAVGGDCDDTDPSIHPVAIERDNGADDDCDGELDEGVRHGDDIQPIWNYHCLLCHIDGGFGGGLVLVGARETLLTQGSGQVDGMPLVAPGDPDASYLWHKLTGTHEEVGGWGESMPYETSLPPDELAFVRAWIAGGALP